MVRKPFLPSARETNWLLIVGFLAIGYAFYLRYLVIEVPEVGIACEGGLATWTCTMRRLAVTLFGNTVFGWTAVAVALLNLVRPSLVLLAAALAAAALGIVLYNTSLSALAAGLLIFSLARPRIAEE